MVYNMEIYVPDSNLSADEIIKTLIRMGAETIGGYAIKNGRYINGAKYEGGNLIKMGKMYLLVIWDEENKKVQLKEIELNEKYVFASHMPITITGMPNGEKALFECKDDAVEWLNTLQAHEVLKLSVKSEDYHGVALMYMEEDE